MALPIGNQYRGDMPGPMTGSYVLFTASHPVDVDTDTLNWRWYVPMDIVLLRADFMAGTVTASDVVLSLAYDTDQNAAISMGSLLLDGIDYDASDNADLALAAGPSGAGLDVSFETAVSNRIARGNYLKVQWSTSTTPGFDDLGVTLTAWAYGHVYDDPQYDQGYAV